jgi:hypothetical protein
VLFEGDSVKEGTTFLKSRRGEKELRPNKSQTRYRRAKSDLLAFTLVQNLDLNREVNGTEIIPVLRTKPSYIVSRRPTGM